MREKGKEQKEGAKILPPAPARCASAPRAAVLQSHPWVPVRSGGMSQHRGRGVTQKLFRSLWFFFHGLAVTELLASCAASRQVLAHRAPMAFRPPCRAVMHTLFFFFLLFHFSPHVFFSWFSSSPNSLLQVLFYFFPLHSTAFSHLPLHPRCTASTPWLQTFHQLLLFSSQKVEEK